MARAGLRVDYHVHTCFSYDSEAALADVLARASAARIDQLCITDHGTIDGALELREMAPAGIEIVVGCEFGTDDGSQVIGLWLQEPIAETRLEPLLRAIREQGGLTLLPHPFRRASGVFRAEMRRSEAFVRDVLALTDLVECFNAADNYEKNLASRRLVIERHLPAVAGSDAHRPSDIGSVWVEYDTAAPVHGVSPREIYFPDQQPSAENVAKRRLMETYHRYERRLPAIVGAGYRKMRRRVRRDHPARPALTPRLQYDLPATTPPRGSLPR